MEKLPNNPASVERQDAPEQAPEELSPVSVCLEEIGNQIDRQNPDYKLIRPFVSFLSKQDNETLENQLYDFFGKFGQTKTEKLLDQIDQAELTREENIAETANYQGSHTLVQFLRMSSPDFQQKFRNILQEATDENDEKVTNVFSRTTPLDELRDRQANLSKNLQKVYSATGYAPASNFFKKENQLGYSPKYGQPGVVFSDAALNGQALNERQRDIINAHENHHAIVLPNRDENLTSKLREGIDSSKLNEINQNSSESKRVSLKYMSSGWEIAARMAQIKNYFGMVGDDVFTKEHLNYAKNHYIADTGLDNNMSNFFAMITDEIEEKFIENMNNLPI